MICYEFLVFLASYEMNAMYSALLIYIDCGRRTLSCAVKPDTGASTEYPSKVG